EAAHYAAVTAANAEALLERTRPGDVVVLHDPQTAGLARIIVDAGVHAVWRCHIGADRTNEHTDSAWAALRPHLEHAEAVIFSRRQYIPAWVPPEAAVVIPPSIDPFSPKNQHLSPAEVHSLVAEADPSLAGLDAPLVVQVSRWDRLKDMAGVMAGFVSGVAPVTDAHLALVGPDVSEVPDDPEGAAVLAECSAAWAELPSAVRDRVHVVTVPMDDVRRNALMVNALQRSATVIVQKSLAEGFGLTVAEGMWKRRPVVGSAVGGIVDQLVPGTGILLDDPADLDTFGRTLAGQLGQPAEIERLGHNAEAHVRDCFVGDRHLLRYAGLFARLCA
ncbi:MAG: glycosyltransferase, partial [Actinomycetota bacterium]